MEQILLYFPINIVKIIEEAIKQNPQIEIYKKAIEIRIKTQKPIIIKLRYRYNHSIPSHRKGHAVHNTKNMRKFNICI